MSIYDPTNDSTSKATIGAPAASTETKTIGVNSFTLVEGGDSGAGNYYDEELYSAKHDDIVISFHFVIHSVNPNVSDPHLRQFDQDKVSKLIESILSTLTWLPD